MTLQRMTINLLFSINTIMFNAKIALIIPTWNAANYIEKLFASIRLQTLQPDHILVIDSSSTDQTFELLQNLPVKIHRIPQHEFDHGGTRQLATELVDADIYIFMTQDALPANTHCFQNLTQELLAESSIGCAYGRQLPASHATPLSAHLRLFNYPPESSTKSYDNRAHFGIKTCFNSNSFAAYRKKALQHIGGFPQKLILGEDIYAAAKMLLHDWKIHYSATAEVYHSHNFNLRQEFQRYFSIGAFHQQENWIIKAFAAPTREGFKFIFSEIRYLLKHKKIHWLPRAFAGWIVKWIGYKLGRNEARLPGSIKQKWIYK